ncbi:MAG: 30S ribosomal protein S17 [Phycisphaerales bacterium]
MANAQQTKPAKKTITRTGIVESDKRDRTRTVVVANVAMHAKYGKFVRTRTVLHVHDEKNTSRLGDLVEVKACPPKSKTKRWELVRVVQQGVGLKFEGVDAPASDEKAPAPAAKAPAKVEKKK